MNQIKPDPDWSPEAHLERVYRRGRQLRRRRQVGATSAVLAAVVGLAVLIGGPTSTVLQPLRTITGSGGGGGESGVVATDETTTTDVFGFAARPHRTTTTDPNATTTTRRPGRTTTTAPSTTTPGGGGGGTPIPTAIGNCKSGDLVYTSHTNKGTYRPNESVNISMAVRNSSQTPCYAPGECGVGPYATVKNNTSGEIVWRNSAKAVTCTSQSPSPPLLNPNDTYDYGTIATWNQIVCPNGDGCSGDHAPIGSYSAIGHRNGVDAQPATFALRSS